VGDQPDGDQETEDRRKSCGQSRGHAVTPLGWLSTRSARVRPASCASPSGNSPRTADRHLPLRTYRGTEEEVDPASTVSRPTARKGLLRSITSRPRARRDYAPAGPVACRAVAAHDHRLGSDGYGA
jgi:hypothetical protein